MSTLLRASLPLALTTSACIAPTADSIMQCPAFACPPSPDSSSSGDATSSDEGHQTVTGGDGTAAEDVSSEGEGVGEGLSEGSGEGEGESEAGEALPVEVEIFLSPSSMAEVGEVEVSIATSRPVASVDIYQGDVPLVLGAAPDEPVHVLEVTSDKAPGDGAHTIRAVAHASDGGSGEAEKELLIDVPPGGTHMWPPYVMTGPINGFTSAAMHGDGIAIAGFFETNQAIEAVAARIDGTSGQADGAPIVLGPVAVTGGGRGPVIAVGDDEAAFVAWTQPAGNTTRWALSQVVFGGAKGPTWAGPPATSVNAIAVVGDVLVLAGAVEVKPGTHDLRVWWVSAKTGALLQERAFAAPFDEDNANLLDEVARGVAIIDDEVVVVGEREVETNDNSVVRRTVVLRHTLDGKPLIGWTSPGEILEEDAGMAVAPLRAGGFVVTGWGRDKETIRQVLTRWFSAAGVPGPVRVEPTPSSDAIGLAVGEDREGKIIIAGARHQPQTDANAWIFAIPGPLGETAWEVIRNGPGQGPDEAAGLAIDAWGYTYVAGSEFASLTPRAFALRLYP